MYLCVCVCDFFVKNQLSVGMWDYIQVFSSILLISLSVLFQFNALLVIPQYTLKSEIVRPAAVLLLFMIVSANLFFFFFVCLSVCFCQELS